MTHASDFGGRLRKLRKRTGMNQTELAEALGVAQTTVSAWERSDDAPRESVLRQLGRYFNAAPSYFIGPSESDVKRQEARRQAAREYVEQRKWEAAHERLRRWRKDRLL